MHCDRSLPLFSTIGRGPRGEGVTVRKVNTTEEGVYCLEFVSTLTGNVIERTPNLTPGESSGISVSITNDEIDQITREGVKYNG